MDPRFLKGRSIVSCFDLSGREAEYIIDLALEFKKKYYLGVRKESILEGRVLALLFQAPSTRTRVSFEVAMAQLGGSTIYIGLGEAQLSRGESVSDTARVLSRYVDCIAARILDHSVIVELALNSSIPVLNALSRLEHPLQALSDMMTLKEEFGSLRGLTLAFIGDGRDNVLNSILALAPKLGVNIRVAAPKQLWPLENYVEAAVREAEYSGCEVIVTEDPREAVDGADAVYTDVWVSMGFEGESEFRRKVLEKYRVTEKLMEHASNRVVFMHCLPAHRGEEVEAKVIDGDRSIVWRQAENKMHLHKAVLALVTP